MSPQESILGPEVVAPLRDAVGLVHRQQVDLGPFQQLGRAGRGEGLGGEVEKPQPRPLAAASAFSLHSSGPRVELRRRASTPRLEGRPPAPA